MRNNRFINKNLIKQRLALGLVTASIFLSGVYLGSRFFCSKDFAFKNNEKLENFSKIEKIDMVDKIFEEESSEETSKPPKEESKPPKEESKPPKEESKPPKEEPSEESKPEEPTSESQIDIYPQEPEEPSESTSEPAVSEPPSEPSNPWIDIKPQEIDLTQ